MLLLQRTSLRERKGYSTSCSQDMAGTCPRPPPCSGHTSPRWPAPLGEAVVVAARLEASAGDLVGDQGTHRGGPAPPAGTWSWGRGQQADVGLEGKGVFVAEDAGWLPVPGDHLQDEGLRGGVQHLACHACLFRL